MGVCDGCPDYQRRVEVYSNRETGCGMEFYVEPKVNPTDPKPTDPTDPTKPDETDPTEPTDPKGPDGGEDEGTKLTLVYTTILAVLSTILLNNY
jgi:hypothetical protein